jgi:A/G-specific adenine glycosylase
MLDEEIDIFQAMLLHWYDINKRTFPWRYVFEPYKVFISEILLQQTNVEKIIKPYFKIINKYKNIYELAEAESEFLIYTFKEIGLFYRADRMISISKEFIDKYNGNIPDDLDNIIRVKGIGRYIGSAILCFGYNRPYAILDTNVIRVFERVLGISKERSRAREDKKLWEFAQAILPQNDYVDYNYALLDFASEVCSASKPKCSNCIFKYMCYF